MAKIKIEVRGLEIGWKISDKYAWKLILERFPNIFKQRGRDIEVKTVV